ncbi:MAG: hypothetical protein HZA90_04750 [Verrucomicrobia bacterium]|nr:hypothetical protein [Verrucomicrobiota bacterium]
MHGYSPVGRALAVTVSIAALIACTKERQDQASRSVLSSPTTTATVEVSAPVASILDETAVPDSALRIPAWNLIMEGLSKRAWVGDLRQVPATVITNGTLRNVPYISFQFSFAYELNIYGELEKPAGFEIGFRPHVGGDHTSAKSNCVGFIESMLNRGGDKEIIRSLKWTEDLVKNDGVAFEVTPPTAADAEGGWWISVYDERAVEMSRASQAEMEAITQTVPSAPVEVPVIPRPLPNDGPITFTNTQGRVFSNVTLKPAPNGLYWFNEKGGGLIRATDVPPDLARRFGVDQESAKAYDRAKQASDERYAAAMTSASARLASQESQATPRNNVNWTSDELRFLPTYSSTRGHSSGGPVWVGGYYRSNGTYVRGHYRSR